MKITTIIMGLLITILIAILFSCMSDSANKYDKSEEYNPNNYEILEQDTNICDTLNIYYFINENFEIEENMVSNNHDTFKKISIKKDSNIKPILIDSTYVINRDSSYKQLDKTSKEIKRQKERVDSLLIIKK
jgi:hypothetical protein